MENPERGDKVLKVGGERYVLRPTFEALCQCEAASGNMPITEVFNHLRAGRMGLRQAAGMVAALSNAAEPERKLRIEDVGPKLLRRLEHVWQVLSDVIEDAVRGGDDGGDEGNSEGSPSPPAE